MIAAVFVAPALAAYLAVSGPAAGADDLDKVDQFLARLGLVDLQILHLEKALDREQPDAVRLKLAQRVADLYAGRLMSSSEDQRAYQELLARIDALVKKVPQANTTSLRVMLLQADYNRAEAQVSRWIHDPAETSARDAGREILARITPELNRFQQQLDAAVTKLVKELDEADDPDVRRAKEKQLQRLAAVAGRAAYFAAWSNYYTGLVNPASGGAKAEFAKARDGFRKLLGIEEKDYAKLQTESLELDSIWRSRAMIGLGLSEAAAGDSAAAGACFKLLEDVSVPPVIRDQAAYWHVQALLSAGRFDEAHRLAQQRIAAFSGDATPGTVSLCVALVRAGFGPHDSPVPEDARATGLLGISGLTRLRQFGTVHKLLEQYKINLDDASGFVLKWLQGQQLYAKAEKSKAKGDYRAAAEALSAALAARDAAAEVASAGRCRYTLGWCYYRLGECEKAARQFEDAVTGLKASGSGDAADSAWMAFACYRRLVPDSPRYTTSAIEVLESIKRDFPTHPYAKKADFQIAKLQQNAVLPAEAIRTLSKIKPGEPHYLAARYDLCLLRYRQWSGLRAKGTDAAAEAEKLREAVDLYLKAAAGDSDTQRKVKSLLLVVATATGASSPDRQLAGSYLAKAAPLVDALPPSSSQAADYHYRAMKHAQEADDAATAEKHAGWLVQHAAGSVYELSALIASAKAADRAVHSAGDAQGRKAQEAHRRALEVYARLSELLGGGREVIASKKNALVAHSKLAYYASQTGRHAEAAAALEKILAAYPTDRDALCRAGLAHYEARQYEPSLRHWRTLLAGLPAASEDWFEAKYYQIRCLLHTDKEMARKVFSQFKLLHPELGPASWHAKFKSLEREIPR